MGNKLCCEENGEDLKNCSYDQDKITPPLEDNNTVCTNDKKNNSNPDKNIRKSLDNNNENNKSNEQFLDEIHNLRSSIFDNDNDNENDNNNNNNNNNNNEDEINNYNNNNLQEISEKKRYNLDYNKSGNNSEKNILKNKKGKKKKKNENDNVKQLKKVTINSPDYKITPLSLNINNIKNKNEYNDKENDFYLINNSRYIGLKNNNSNLVFVKNNIEITNKYELTPLFNTKIITGYNNSKIIDNNVVNNIKKNNNNFCLTERIKSIDPNNIITNKNHKIYFGIDTNDKNDSYLYTNRNKNKDKNKDKNLIDNVNKYEIFDKIHNNNNRIIEIYIKNQVQKIINVFKNKLKNKGNNKNIYNNENINYNNNYNNSSSKYNNNNSTYYINNNDDTRIQILNNSGKGINNISFDVLNTGTCQTILNKETNFCIRYFDNGGVYIGEIKNNKCNGRGKYLNTKGDITMSFFEDNYLQGYGLIEIRRNNSVFEGNFDKSKFNGYGIELYEDGSTYYGKYENNKKSGLGTYDWGDGSQYQGEWKKGLPDGYGIFSDSKNRIYEGEWKKGKMNGIGLYKWDDGRKYIGLFNEDKREGFGIFFWPKPLKIYLGFWINGVQNGIGKIYTSFKEKYYLWQEGKIVKKLSGYKMSNLEFDMESKKLIKKYSYFFKMTLDDLLTLILDL